MSTSASRVSAALDIMMRMPPSRVEQSLSGIIGITPGDADELLQRIDQPLQEQVDEETGKKYLICDYNRDGDSYRSPWSNKYDPPLEDGLVPPAVLRELEVQANNVFTSYAQAYFSNPITSVYFWDLADGAFASCWLIKKELSGGRFVKEGSWDSIHVVEAQPAKDDGGFNYKATTTCMVSMTVESAELGSCNLSGSLIREKSSRGVLDESKGRTHIYHIGTLIETLENSMRESIEGVYLGKTNAVISSIHSTGGFGQRVNLLGLGSTKEKTKAPP
eukprot:CAMPEP_0195518232 /NCGR_PEP_ID=MMETSP0794_2-20130614/12625_1 /TAXON_ID=515487 /ORGANISM="Stephanopyxis turris, Strain CCMP 815" /LENGTH=275 /DNA_ID=CAMNT_0040647167 /DNA_START=62 /DNA_END=889 /DNA_ORIENTATION=+